MTLSTTKKRLDSIEIHLTPKEWAIRIADEIRRHPSQDDFTKVELKRPYKESLFQRPYDLLEKQAEERESGKTRQNVEARHWLRRKLQSDFHLLKTIVLEVNLCILQGAEALRLKTALRLSLLHSLVLQDAFASTARKSSSWVRKCKSSTTDKEERRTVLGNLSSHTRVPPSMTEDWVDDIISLFVEVFTHQGAVQIIENKYFDGHPILYRDLENGLDETMKMIEGGVATFNEYMKAREALFKVYKVRPAGPVEREGRITIDLDDIKDQAGKQLVAARADHWVKCSREKTEASNLEAAGDHLGYVAFEWNRLREIFGVEV
jgi:hypothetical protein